MASPIVSPRTLCDSSFLSTNFQYQKTGGSHRAVDTLKFVHSPDRLIKERVSRHFEISNIDELLRQALETLVGNYDADNLSIDCLGKVY